MKLLIWGVSNIGKTTIGRELSGKLQCKFYDVDEEIMNIYGSIDNFQDIYPNDYDRFDGYDGDKMYEEIENVLNKLSKEWEKKNNNPKLKIDNGDRCEVINGDWIRSIYTYKL